MDAYEMLDLLVYVGYIQVLILFMYHVFRRYKRVEFFQLTSATVVKIQPLSSQFVSVHPSFQLRRIKRIRRKVFSEEEPFSTC